MTDGNPPMTFHYGCPPPRHDEPKYILPVMPRRPFSPTQNPMDELFKALEAMKNRPDYSTVIAKLDALVKFVTGWAKTLNDSVATAQTKTFGQIAEVERRLVTIETLLARINNQVTTINEFIAVLRAVKPRKRKTAKRGSRKDHGRKNPGSRKDHAR